MKNSVSPKLNCTWLLSLCAGIIFLNFPFIQVFNREGDFFGIPLLVAYIFLVWSLLVVGLVVFSRTLRQNTRQHKKAEKRRKER